jgi:hypothetical protein
MNMQIILPADNQLGHVRKLVYQGTDVYVTEHSMGRGDMPAPKGNPSHCFFATYPTTDTITLLMDLEMCCPGPRLVWHGFRYMLLLEQWEWPTEHVIEKRAYSF